MESVEFLRSIYSKQCESGDYVILSAKDKINWKDYAIRYNPKTIKKDLQKFFKLYPSEKFDLYWSPMPYSKPNRLIKNSLDTKFLAQDIDEHEDPEKLDPQPTYIWESSPNKFQGLWELDRYIEEKEYTPLNEALAVHGGFDNCWDFPHVYRVPGSRNHKYKDKPKVGLPSNTRKIYRPKTISDTIGFNSRAAKTPPVKDNGSSNDLTERRIYANYSIPQKVRDLLALEDLTGIDRSSTIWFIENSLSEIGMSPNEIIHLVKRSAFNKYRGRKDEVKMLKKELTKIISGSIQEQETQKKQTKKIELTSYQEVMSNNNTFEGWLVKGFWGRRSHGIVAGMPKSFKSTLVHDLVVSVASGRNFLGKYPVLDPGPVIVIQNENADYIMRDRTEKLILNRNLQGEAKKVNERVLKLDFPEDLPIHFINQQGFSISNEEHRATLEEMVKEIKPVLVVFDPLYLMFEGDLNSAQDLNPALNWLLQLKNKYKTSVMLIHHYNKGGATQGKGGARMAGSIFLYGWIESAWYLTKPEKEEVDSSSLDESSIEPAVVTLTREFRMAGQFPDVDISLDMGEVGDPAYHVDVKASSSDGTVEKVTVNKRDIEGEVMNILSLSSGPVSLMKLVKSTGFKRNDVKAVIEKLFNQRKIFREEGGYLIYK